MIKVIKDFIEDLFRDHTTYENEAMNISEVRALHDSKGLYMDHVPFDLR